jgi:hypothetical protein
MASSGMLLRVALVRTNFSEELSASVIRVTRICELGTILAVTSNRRTLSGPRSRPTATQKIWQRRESNPRPLGLQPGSLITRPKRRSIKPEIPFRRGGEDPHIKWKERDEMRPDEIWFSTKPLPLFVCHCELLHLGRYSSDGDMRRSPETNGVENNGHEERKSSIHHMDLMYGVI